MFTLTDDQRSRITVWASAQNVATQQRQLASKDEGLRAMADHAPYFGAIGGALTYCFTPTSLGVCVVVKHAGTNAEINVTDFDSW